MSCYLVITVGGLGVFSIKMCLQLVKNHRNTRPINRNLNIIYLILKRLYVIFLPHIEVYLFEFYSVYLTPNSLLLTSGVPPDSPPLQYLTPSSW